MTDKQWQAASGLLYADPRGAYAVQVDTAWALLRFFRTGEDWGDQETKRQWAKEELEAFLERDVVPKKPSGPRLVP